jgi:hypothetical protein
MTLRRDKTAQIYRIFAKNDQQQNFAFKKNFICIRSVKKRRKKLIH